MKGKVKLFDLNDYKNSKMPKKRTLSLPTTKIQFHVKFNKKKNFGISREAFKVKK